MKNIKVEYEFYIEVIRREFFLTIFFKYDTI
jgi:hypothetical protein